jgi:hypothetical protein
MNCEEDVINPDRSIRLRGSGNSVDPASLPESFIESMVEAYKKEDDPYAILATYAYIFCGMKINEIRDMFIISDRNRPRKASREYIRQKIVSMFKDIGDIYEEKTGKTSVAPIYPGEEEHAIGYMVGGTQGKIVVRVEDVDDDSQDHTEEEGLQGKRKRKQKARPSSKGSPGGNNTDNRPRNPLSWLGSIKDKFQG